jgi:hypothetical protein
VEKHVEQNGDKVDVTDIAAKMAESLADLILFSVPENEQRPSSKKPPKMPIMTAPA